MTGPTLPTIAVPRLELWRHGRTEWNATGRFQGQLDPPLDAMGHQEAAAAAAHLVATGILPAGTVVVSSDLDRTVQTANVLTALLGAPLRRDARLREHGMGCWEGLTRAEVAERYPDQYADPQPHHHGYGRDLEHLHEHLHEDLHGHGDAHCHTGWAHVNPHVFADAVHDDVRGREPHRLLLRAGAIPVL